MRNVGRQESFLSELTFLWRSRDVFRPRCRAQERSEQLRASVIRGKSFCRLLKALRVDKIFQVQMVVDAHLVSLCLLLYEPHL